MRTATKKPVVVKGGGGIDANPHSKTGNSQSSLNSVKATPKVSKPGGEVNMERLASTLIAAGNHVVISL